LTVPVDITDPKLVRAYAHPLRIRILALLDNRVASPSEIATELDTPLPNTAYHVRQLASLGFIKLVGRKVRGGAVEHRYTATVRPVISDAVHASLPDIVKRAVAGGHVENGIQQVLDALRDGGFQRDRSHFTRSSGRIDAKGWEELADILYETLRKVDGSIEKSEARVARGAKADATTATVVMALFEGPRSKAVPEREPGPRKRRRSSAKAGRGGSKRSA
jgi:DNA-binding transcriptional ArsR family regulator